MKHTIFITGGAGYVGAMLIREWSLRPDVEHIVVLDKNKKPFLLHEVKNITWIQANTSDETWQVEVAKHKPDIVVHTAWQIREMYGKKSLQWQWNVVGSRKVFDFAFSTPSVKRLIHFSTASGYGAEKTNTLEHMFQEDETLREKVYLYGIEKIAAERQLEEAYKQAKESSKKEVPNVVVVRPAAITGPRGRFMLKRFGLQTVLRKGLPIIPIANKIWCRQFIHEDDVVDIMTLFAFQELKKPYDVFNITPNSIVVAKDMAEIMKKRTFTITPFLVRIAFALAWNITRGRIPTSRGGWKFYSYPIVMDGRKITREYGYVYAHESRPALEYVKGEICTIY